MDDAVSDAALDIFCGDKSRDFLQLPILFSKFIGVDHAATVNLLLCQYSRLNHHVSRAEFLRSSVLENSPHQVRNF